MIDWDLIRAIISFGGLILILLFFIKMIKMIKMTKGSTMIKTKVILGFYCYGCKDHIDEKPMEDFTRNNPLATDKEVEDYLNTENFRLCTACKRDYKLNEITKTSKLSHFILKSKKYLYSRKSRFLPLYYLVLYFIFLALDMWMKAIDSTRIFFYVYNVLLFAYWYTIFKRIDLDYIKGK